jgi:hypothetical protein
LLNSSAAFIWEKLRLGLAPDQIGFSLAEAYRLSEEIAQRDVLATLRQWDDLLAPRGASQSVWPEAAPVSRQKARSSYCWKGVSFHVDLDSAELEAEIRPRLSELQVEQGAPEFTLCLTTNEDEIRLHYLSKHGDCEMVGSEVGISAARAILLQEIVRRANGAADWLAILHAGACGNESSCVIFPAASHSGKSTLAAVLMQRGLTFYSDDSVALQKDSFRIPCMPFGLAIREGSWDLIESRFPDFLRTPVENRFGERIRFLHPKPHGNLARAVAIVFTEYRPGAGFSLQCLNTLETLLRLQDSGFWVDPHQEEIGSFLVWLQSLPGYQLTYDDVDQVSEWISSFL